MEHARIFVTGATGYLGGAVAARLVRAGHLVTGLTRDADQARALAAAGITPVVGDLTRPGPWCGVLQNHDVVVHAAFDPDHAAGTDLAAIETFRNAALDGRVRTLLYTSGAWVHGNGVEGVADEDTPLTPLRVVRWRPAHEQIARDLAAQDVRVVVLRPTMVYGGANGIPAGWFAEAHAEHTVTVPGDGSQHWSLVHRDDLAEAYALALEHAPADSTYLLSDEAGLTVEQLAQSVARTTGSKLQHCPAKDLVKAHGMFGETLLNDLRVSSARARRELGWVPRHPSFAGDVVELWLEWLKGRETTVR
jgi:nucleoside-diphosphate-sugar epimerase